MAHVQSLYMPQSKVGSKRGYEQIMSPGDSSRQNKSRKMAGPSQHQRPAFHTNPSNLTMQHPNHGTEHAVNIAKSFGKSVPFDISPIQAEQYPMEMTQMPIPEDVQYYEASSQIPRTSLQSRRLVHPPMAFMSNEQIVYSEDGCWAIAPPVYSSDMASSQYAHGMVPMLEHHMTSPHHSQHNGFIDVRHSSSHAINDDATVYMQPMSKSFNEIQDQAPESRPTSQTGRHSDMSPHPNLVGSMNGQVWQMVETQSSPLHESSIVNGSLPPQPESVILHPSGYSASGPQPYHFEEQDDEQSSYGYVPAPGYQIYGYQMPAHMSQSNFPMVRS